MHAFILVVFLIVLPVFLFVVRTWFSQKVIHRNADELNAERNRGAEAASVSEERVKRLEEENERLSRELLELKERLRE